MPNLTYSIWDAETVRFQVQGLAKLPSTLKIDLGNLGRPRHSQNKS